MLINEESPLRKLPTNLNPKQARFCDGVRFASEMADLAYQQLSIHLQLLSRAASTNERISAVPSFLFAWSVIDSAHRLRGLVQSFPTLAKKNRSPEFRKFLEKAEGVEGLRNVVQHMGSEICRSAEDRTAAWGVLTWLSPTPDGTIYSCVLISGAMMPGLRHSAINPAGLIVRSPLDHVTLTVGDVAVNLSDVITALASLVGSIERGLAEVFKVFPDRAGSDMLIALAMEPSPDNRG